MKLSVSAKTQRKCLQVIFDEIGKSFSLMKRETFSQSTQPEFSMTAPFPYCKSNPFNLFYLIYLFRLSPTRWCKQMLFMSHRETLTQTSWLRQVYDFQVQWNMIGNKVMKRNWVFVKLQIRFSRRKTTFRIRDFLGISLRKYSNFYHNICRILSTLKWEIQMRIKQVLCSL